jgi:hypothetical protein
MRLYRSNTDRVLWPEIRIATTSGIPALTMLRTAVRQKTCRIIPERPAFVQAVSQAFRKLRCDLPETVLCEDSETGKARQ